MSKDAPKYTLEFYEDDAGKEPALDWMRSLDSSKRRAVGVALQEFLAYLGPEVADSNFGKALGGGLYEFRLDQNAEQILRRKGKAARTEPSEKILLRVFFHAHGDKRILLLCGYDKAEHPSRSYQDSQIAQARTLLSQWKERRRRA